MHHNKNTLFLFFLSFSSFLLSMKEDSKKINLITLPQETRFHIYTDRELWNRDMVEISCTCRYLSKEVTKEKVFGYILSSNTPIYEFLLGEKFLRNTLSSYIAQNKFDDITRLCSHPMTSLDDLGVNYPFGDYYIAEEVLKMPVAAQEMSDFLAQLKKDIQKQTDGCELEWKKKQQELQAQYDKPAEEEQARKNERWQSCNQQ